MHADSSLILARKFNEAQRFRTANFLTHSRLPTIQTFDQISRNVLRIDGVECRVRQGPNRHPSKAREHSLR